MKKILPAIVILFLAGLACQLGSPAVTQIVVTPVNTDVAQAPAPQENSDIFIEVGGRSSLDITSDLLPYLTRLGWGQPGMQENGIMVDAPQGLGLREIGLVYQISFDTGGPRYLAIVSTDMYFVPERIGTPYDEVLLFSALNRDFPAISVYQSADGYKRTTFRGVYTFNTSLNVNDFINYLNYYAGSVDDLLAQYPYFSKQ